jgi:hypothetical protein
MSIQANFPAIKPSLLLDFANAKALDPRITFTRASTATYYGTQTAKAEENLVVQSQDFFSIWANSNSTTTTNTAVAPDGTTTADTLTDNAVSNAHNTNQSPVLIAGAVYTWSLFLKASTNNYAVVTLTNPTTVQNGISVVVDLSTGAITQTGAGTSATLTSSSITSVGNGWYRVSITGSSVAGFNRAEVGLAPAATGNTFSTSQRIAYIGTGTSIFLWGAQLEQRSSMTAYIPTTTAPITNYIPQLLTAASGVARFDHNPTTDESLGLLIEEQRTNLALYSEQFDNAAWTKTRSSVTANIVTSPDGTVNADKVVEDTTASSTHTILQTVAVTSGTSYTFSVYVKPAGRSRILIAVAATAFTANQAIFDLTNGTTSSVVACTASMTLVGNGWYRCSWTATATASASPTFNIFLDNGTTNTYTGDGYSGIYIWGAQLEAGAFPTSYIPTVASQVTRSADAASITGTNFSSWYNAGQGTLYSEASTNDVSVARNCFVINDGTTSNRIITGHGANPKAFIATGGTTQTSQNIASVVFTAGTFSKVASAYADNNGNAAANGTTGTLDTSMTIPVVTQLQLGSQAGGATQTLNGAIKKLAYYPLRLTDAQLQALTS